MKSEQLVPVARTLLRAHSARGARPEDLAKALATGRPRRLEGGVQLCQEGDPSDALFVLLQGEVRVSRRDSEGTPRELAILTAPALIGHMGLVDGSPRSATCETRGEVGLLALSAVAFRETLSRADDAGAAMRHLILASLIQQLSTANDKVRGLLDQLADEPEPEPSAPLRRKRRQVEEDDILKLAGVLDGWTVDPRSLDEDVEFVEDDDMRRTREARTKR
ncbi:MAG: CRP-like cAMP-binding protein [Myxococcota bacterium]|jgi:CRP-like cAMP-binding protein